MAHRRFTDEFKKTAIALVREQKIPIRKVAADLGIGSASLIRWLRQYRECGSSVEVGEQMDLQRQVDELKRQVLRLTMERDILKKAAAYFARDPL